MQSQCNLNRAWTSWFIQRAGGAEALVQHERGLSKEKVGQRWLDIAEIRMVEEVVGFGSQLQVKTIRSMTIPDRLQC
jgi:hypothetical protein